MFEKIGMAAETLATNVSVSRRGFFGQFARLAGGVALGVMAVATPKAAAGFNPCNLPCCGCYCRDYTCRRDRMHVCKKVC